MRDRERETVPGEGERESSKVSTPFIQVRPVNGWKRGRYLSAFLQDQKKISRWALPN